MTKDALRKVARQRRRAFVADRGDALLPAEGPAVDQLVRLFRPGTCIAGYAAMHSEADPIGLLKRLHKLGYALALPWIGMSDAPMLFRSWAPGAPLTPADAKFVQPLDTMREVTPDIILMPLVAFDASGNRLGQGAGHYDRALAQRPNALRIGIGWSVQAVDNLPADPWDLPLDAMLTEQEWLVFPQSRITP